MMVHGEVILGQGEAARRRWRSERLHGLVSGTVLVALWLTLWSGLVTSVAMGAQPGPGAVTRQQVQDDGG